MDSARHWGIAECLQDYVSDNSPLNVRALYMRSITRSTFKDMGKHQKLDERDSKLYLLSPLLSTSLQSLSNIWIQVGNLPPQRIVLNYQAIQSQYDPCMACILWLRKSQVVNKRPPINSTRTLPYVLGSTEYAGRPDGVASKTGSNSRPISSAHERRIGSCERAKERSKPPTK